MEENTYTLKRRVERLIEELENNYPKIIIKTEIALVKECLDKIVKEKEL